MSNHNISWRLNDIHLIYNLTCEKCNLNIEYTIKDLRRKGINSISNLFSSKFKGFICIECYKGND